MTEEQKEILIAKMLDAPSSLSDKELELILCDKELREIYDASSAISNACIRQPELDMAAEWRRFRPRINRKPAAIRWVMRAAAALLGVLLASGICFILIDKVFTDDQSPAIAEAGQGRQEIATPPAPEILRLAEPAEETAQEQEAAIAHSEVTQPHIAKAELSKPEPAVEDGVDIETEEFLRIQQARIDNDLAMQNAEAYIEEYNDLAAILDAAGAYNPALDNMIKQVTME